MEFGTTEVFVVLQVNSFSPFLLLSFPSFPPFPISQPCHDDPDKEQRIKELELLLMSAENEVRRQSGPRVRTTVCERRIVRLDFPTPSIPPLSPFLPLTSALGDPSLPSLLLHLIVACCQ